MTRSDFYFEAARNQRSRNWRLVNDLSMEITRYVWVTRTTPKKALMASCRKVPFGNVLETFLGMFWRGSERNFLDITFVMISCHLDIEGTVTSRF